MGNTLSRKILATWYWLVITFFFAPLLVVVVFSFNSSSISVLPLHGFTLDWYKKLFSNVQIGESLRYSMLVAGVTVLLSVTLGTSLAIGIHRQGGRFSKGVLAFATAPMILPRLILGVALLTFLDAASIRLSLLTVVLGHSLIGIPYVTIIVHARLSGFDRRLEEAAWDLGAGFFNTLRTITIPLIMPAIVASALIAFTLSFDDVVVAFFTTGIENTLPMLLWGMLRYGITPEINALSTIILLFSGLTAVLAEILLRTTAKTSKEA